MPKEFNPSSIKKLYKPDSQSTGEDNGQVTIVGGSSLFHGAPILALKTASRLVDMVFFATPEKSVGFIAEHMKSRLSSFIWVPWDDLDKYIEKSDAVLIGSGFMRFTSEKVKGEKRYSLCDEACQSSREITQTLLRKFPTKKWVIDAGSLQVISESDIPKGAVITPNLKEFCLLFDLPRLNIGQVLKNSEIVQQKAKNAKCVIVLKGPQTIVASETECLIIKGGNAGMTKGGTGDVHAGLTVGLFAKNDPFLSAVCASYLVKAAGDSLFRKVGVNYSADDLANEIPSVFKFSA